MKRLATLVAILTQAQMKARYRKTFAGFLWVIINPILMFTVHALVFKKILNLNVPNYLTFLLGALIPWVFITSTLNMSINSFISSREIINAFKINPISLVITHVLDNAVNFLIAFTLLFIALLINNKFSITGLLLLPLPIASMLIGTCAISVFLATAQVFLRDILYVNQFVTSIMYFLTPIFYPKSFIPEGYQWAVNFNPYYLLIEPLQICVWNFDSANFLESIIKSLIFTSLSVTVAVYYWRKKTNEFYLYI